MTDAPWDSARWARALDRIEVRDPEVGLRFSGPPLWLEVTMAGPDSRSVGSAARDLPPQAWDWTSDAPCDEAMRALAAGADDDTLVEAASRYTFTNLVLNAVHEIGEWLRLDGERVVPAHGGPQLRSGSAAQMRGDGPQGNGPVVVHVDFRPAAPDAPGIQTTAEPPGRAPPSTGRWTYLPGTAITTRADGPVLTDGRPGRDGHDRTTTGAWSAADADGCGSVARDVHALVVRAEVAWLCRAMHVDGVQAFWPPERCPSGGRAAHVAVRHLPLDAVVA